MQTIFDTDFAPDDKVLCYRATSFAYAGTVEGMSDDLKALFVAER